MSKILSKDVKEALEYVTAIKIYKPYKRDPKYIVETTYTMCYEWDFPVWLPSTLLCIDTNGTRALDADIYTRYWCEAGGDACNLICSYAKWQAAREDYQCCEPDTPCIDYKDGKWEVTFESGTTHCKYRINAENYWYKCPDDKELFQLIETELKSGNKVKLVYTTPSNKTRITSNLAIRKRSIIIE